MFSYALTMINPQWSELIEHAYEDIKPGGLGTFFINQIMDDVVFKKDQKKWVNHLVLTKNLSNN